MALWAGTSLNTNILASAFNNLLSKKAVNFARDRYALLGALMGDPKTGVGDADPMFDKANKVSGNKHEIRLIGAIPTITPTASGSALVGSASGNYDVDAFGAFEFDLTNLPFTQDLPQTEIDKIAGDEAKTASWLDDITNEYVMPGFFDLINSKINSNTNAPSDTEITSWVHIIATDNTYGLDRTDSANANFRGNVNSSTGTLGLNHINGDKNTIATKGGLARLGIAGETVYGIVEQLIQPFAHVTYDADVAKFGATDAQFANIRWLLEADAPTQTYGMLDPRDWGFVMRKGKIETFGPERYMGLVAGYRMQFYTAVQLYCKNPRKNVRRTGITA